MRFIDSAIKPDFFICIISRIVGGQRIAKRRFTLNFGIDQNGVLPVRAFSVYDVDGIFTFCAGMNFYRCFGVQIQGAAGSRSGFFSDRYNLAAGQIDVDHAGLGFAVVIRIRIEACINVNGCFHFDFTMSIGFNRTIDGNIVTGIDADISGCGFIDRIRNFIGCYENTAVNSDVTRGGHRDDFMVSAFNFHAAG